MKSVAEHLVAALDAVGPVAPLDVVLADAIGCIVAEDILAPYSLPRADVATLDGYAVVAADVAKASAYQPVALPVVADAPIGLADPMRLVPGGAVRIMSGAPMPAGAEAVVPVEATDRGMATVEIRDTVAPGANVRAHASDIRAGQLLVPAGERIGARQLALVGAVGLGRVRVHPRPRVVVVSVGDELVEPGRSPAPGQSFDANGIALTSAIQDAGADAFRVGVVPDERVRLREALEDQLVRADLLVTTGGLSAGERDTVKEVLAPLGTVRFDNVAMSPGRQHGLGTIGSDILGDPVPIFALPGHPVAAYVAYEVFVRPALRKMAGHTELYRTSVVATATHPWDSTTGVREFVRVAVAGDPNGYTMTPVGDVHEPFVSALSLCNALAVVGENVEHVHAGDALHAMILEG